MDGILRPVRSEWLLQRLATRITIVATIAIVAVFLRQCFFDLLRICRIHSSRNIIECRHTYPFRVYRTVVLLMIAIRVARLSIVFSKKSYEYFEIMERFFLVLENPIATQKRQSISETAKLDILIVMV